MFQQYFGSKEPNGSINDILDEMPKSKIKVGDAKDVRGPYPFFTSGQNILEYTEALVDGRNIFLNTGGNADVKYYIGPAAYSTDTWCIKAKNDMTDMLYLLLKGMQSELDSIYFEGSALRHLQKPKLKSLAIYIPTDEELKTFNSIVASLFNKIAANVAENKILEHTRDALLPKLMSGEIDVSKVDISDPSCLDKSLFIVILYFFIEILVISMIYFIQNESIIMARGIIYILTNDAMPGFIKIGRTDKTVEQRMKQLDKTGCPLPFRCHFAVRIDDYEENEANAHKIFAGSRVRSNREFFRVAPEDAVALLEVLAKGFNGEEIKTENYMIGENGIVKDEDIKINNDNSSKKQFDFSAVGIKAGSVLEFARTLKDGTVLKCTVNDSTHKKKVSFNKTDYSLSELAKKIMTEHFGTNWKHYRGPDFFKYNGEILSERKNRMLGDTE